MWKAILAAIGHTDEAYWALRRRLRARRGEPSTIEIAPYRGYGAPAALKVWGRVLVHPAASQQNPDDAREKSQSDDYDDDYDDDDESTWRNVLDMYRRFASEELPGARVQARIGERVAEGVTDDEGYFTLTLPAEMSPFAAGWHTVELTLPEPAAALPVTGQALVPPADATFGIISDIDDTVLQTNATNLLKLARTTLLNSAATRLPFLGVADFYQALQAGPSGRDRNPIFYLSSSPWNLYDLLVDFMALNQIPAGPLILQDYGIDAKKVIKLSHSEHKLVRIRELLDLYSTLPFVLIGDSGEHDPELYAQAIAEYPGRIRAIYIRDVSDEARDDAVRLLAERSLAHGVEVVLIPDSAAAARHAAAHGLIEPARLPEIEAATARAKDARKSVVEEIING